MRLLALLLLTAVASAAPVIYIAPDGNDSAVGDFDAPLATPRAALDRMRDLRAGSPNRGGQLIFRGGHYVLEDTLHLKAVDSGGEGAPLVLRAHEGEYPVFSGGVEVGDWTVGSDGVWSAEVGDLDFRQLYINGRKAVRAREPDVGEFHRLRIPERQAGWVSVPEPFVEQWEQFEKVEMHVTLLWAEGILRLKSFESDPENEEFVRLRFQDPESSLIFGRMWPRFVANQAFHFENARAFLDEPGEWFLDRDAGRLYYLPRQNERPGSAVAILPRLDQLMRIEGSADAPVRNVQIRGITFSHSNWTGPSERGHTHLQAGQYSIEPTVDNIQYVARPPAAVLVNWVEDSVFLGNRFHHLGNTALDLHTGASRNEIEGNIFYDNSATAIQIGEFSPPDLRIHEPWIPNDLREVCMGNRVANNYIRRIGTDYPGSCGIAAGYVAELVIQHNEICELPYSGISVGWGWTDQPSPLRDNIIRYNHIHSVMRELTDGGAVYTLSLQPGTEIHHNHIHHNRLTPKSHDPFSDHSRGIYLDEASGGTAGHPFIVRENAVYANTQDYRMHVPGTVLWDAQLDYMNPHSTTPQRRPGSEIAAIAGLEEEWSWLTEAMNYTPFSPFPQAREILSRAQLEAAGSLPDVQRIVMTTELVNDPEQIARYDYLHSAEGVWPAVIDAAEISGIESIQIFRFDNRLVMIIDLPKGVDSNEVFATYDASSPRIKEWAAIMSSIQRALPGRPEEQKWSLMSIIHDYAGGEVR